MSSEEPSQVWYCLTNSPEPKDFQFSVMENIKETK